MLVRGQPDLADFTHRWNPILDVFDGEGLRFAHEVHLSEIAYDYWSGVVKLFGMQQFSGTAGHHPERCSDSEGLFGDLIPYLKSGG